MHVSSEPLNLEGRQPSLHVIELLPILFSFTISSCIGNCPTKIISGFIMCLFFILPLSIPHGSISVLGETMIVVILLLFFIVFHYNPSLSVLGPTIITGHEAGLQQVAVKGF